MTKVIGLDRNLGFGTVKLGDTATQGFTIHNFGNTELSFTGITATGGTGWAGLTAAPTSGIVPPSGALTVTVAFAPTVAQAYSTTLSVTSDATTGNNSCTVSGSGQ
jgi:hypothetical protein